MHTPRIQPVDRRAAARAAADMGPVTQRQRSAPKRPDPKPTQRLSSTRRLLIEADRRSALFGPGAVIVSGQGCAGVSGRRAQSGGTEVRVAQRRSFPTALSETGVPSPGGFELAPGEGELANHGGPADLVVATGLSTSRDLEHALNQAATRAARIGAAADAIRRVPPYAPAFVPFNHGAAANGLEPFIYRVKVPYRDGKKQRQIELDWQQAGPFRGYIVRQKDTGDARASAISPNPVGNPHGKGQVDTFNMAHAPTGGQALSTHLAQDTDATRETNEARIDARTKLAGEGARWLLVRTHSHTIADDSRIWTQHKGQVYWVTFRTLWLSWLAVFNAEYDIPDSVVATKLVNDPAWVDPPRTVKRNRWQPASRDVEVQR